MHGRIRPDEAPELSGTSFYNPANSGSEEKEEQPGAIDKQSSPEGGAPAGAAKQGK